MEGQWRPADAYKWVVNPHRPDDMRVIATNAWLDQLIKPSAPAMSMPSPVTSAFDQGLADRAELDQWFASLSGELRRGADWWAAHRSAPNPGMCSGPASGITQEFIAGCEAAKARLAPRDIRRKADSEYRRGWNGYTGSPAPTAQPPQVQLPVNQGGNPNANASDEDLAAKLNQQELQRIMDQSRSAR